MMTDESFSSEAIERVYRAESRRVFATLVRLLGDFDLAEEALHDAFTSALEQWPKSGIPQNPRAWLVSAGRFKAIDVLRRRARFDGSLAEIAARLGTATGVEEAGGEHWQDDRLRLVFTCCHPALALESQVALTLREVCGLSTEEIAHAFLTSAPALAQRIVRAKAKIKKAGIPYHVPGPDELPERLDSVLHVVYLVFNEGYSASAGETLTRPDLSTEAIRLGRLIDELLPQPEVAGLVALMLLQESRRAARETAKGDIVLLEDQDRRLWNQAFIREGTTMASRALAAERVGPFAIQAAIAAEHAAGSDAAATRWDRIVQWYDALLQAAPSPIVELNRAVAVAMHEGPAAGLALIDAILARGELAEYHLAHAARADLCRRAGDLREARRSYQQALALARQAPERRFLERRLSEIS